MNKHNRLNSIFIHLNIFWRVDARWSWRKNERTSPKAKGSKQKRELFHARVKQFHSCSCIFRFTGCWESMYGCTLVSSYSLRIFPNSTILYNGEWEWALRTKGKRTLLERKFTLLTAATARKGFFQAKYPYFLIWVCHYCATCIYHFDTRWNACILGFVDILFSLKSRTFLFTSSIWNAFLWLPAHEILYDHAEKNGERENRMKCCWLGWCTKKGEEASAKQIVESKKGKPE